MNCAPPAPHDNAGRVRSRRAGLSRKRRDRRARRSRRPPRWSSRCGPCGRCSRTPRSPSCASTGRARRFSRLRSGWRRETLPFADFDWCRRLAKLVANSTRQRIDEESPLLSASLPERGAHPDRAAAGDDARLRRHHHSSPVGSGLVDRGARAERDLPRHAARERGARSDGERAAAPARGASLRGVHAPGGREPQEHPGVGADGLGQDDLDQGADPRDPERGAPHHDRGCPRAGARPPSQSRAALLLQGRPGSGARDAEAAARSRVCACSPDRILLAELRAEEAFDYLRNVNSGHPGSITSVHAASAELAFEQLVLLVKQSRARRRSSPAPTSRTCCICWSTS